MARRPKNWLEKVEYAKGVSSADSRQIWYHFYRNYFIGLAQSYFVWKNVPDTIPKNWIEKTLVNHGNLAMFNTEDYGLVVTRGTKSHKLNIYGDPIMFTPTTPNGVIRKPREVIYTLADCDSVDNGCVVFNSNNINMIDAQVISMFAEQLSYVEVIIRNNRNAQNRPFVVVANDENIHSMKIMYTQIESQDPVLYLKQDKATQTNIAENISVLNTQTPFLLAELADDKQRIISQVLTYLGVNNNAVDKAERLVKAEATSNNGLIRASVENRLKARQEACDLANKYFGLNMSVEITPEIASFNIETVLDDLDGGGQADDLQTDD